MGEGSIGIYSGNKQDVMGEGSIGMKSMLFIFIGNASED